MSNITYKNSSSIKNIRRSVLKRAAIIAAAVFTLGIGLVGLLPNSGTVAYAAASTPASTEQLCGNGKCDDPAAVPNAKCTKSSCDLIKKYVNPLINLLSVCFGIIATASIIMGGIQYASSAGDPQKVSAAKVRIVNTLIAVVAYFFLYGFLQFLVPGGISR